MYLKSPGCRCDAPWDCRQGSGAGGGGETRGLPLDTVLILDVGRQDVVVEVVPGGAAAASARSVKVAALVKS